jgi:hypothetical protein
MNTTHPDAKPREQRERDETIWCWSPMGNRYCITTANGYHIANVNSADTARRLVNEHNRWVLA